MAIREDARVCYRKLRSFFLDQGRDYIFKELGFALKRASKE